MKTNLIPLYKTPYKAPSWLPGGNAQTIYPYLVKLTQPITYRRERWELEDGDFVDLDWVDGSPDAPLIVFFHGLEGGSDSHYVLNTINHLNQYDWRCVVIHFRGCSGTPNRLPRAYHAGDSAEIDWMLKRVADQTQAQKNGQPIYAIGVSLGGNALLKWLGEQQENATKILAGAAAISVPLDLAAAGAALDAGFNRIYTRHFLNSLIYKAKQKLDQFPGLFDAKALTDCSSIYQFDHLVTAPLHGFRNTDEYWQQSSSKPWLAHICVPTMVINARNDPFMPPSALPVPQVVASDVTLEFPEEGGHAGFIHSSFPGKLDWLPQRVISFFHYDCTKRFENTPQRKINLS